MNDFVPDSDPAKSHESAIKAVLLAEIRIDGGTQSRVLLNDSVVSEYADLMKAGIQFPPVVLYFDGSNYWLSDGFHRVHAARTAELDNIAAEIRPGTKRDALLASLGANSTHGLPRTNADKRRAVDLLLRDPEWSQWSDREIARRAAVSDMTVHRIRAALTATKLQLETHSRTYTTKHGSQASMDTSRIGRIKTPCTMPPRAPEPQPKRVDVPKDIPTSAENRAPRLTESVALRYSSEAIGLLGRIPPNDRLRGEALDDVLRWINFNR